MDVLLKQGKNPNELSSDGFAPLCIAAFWGHADIVRLLLEHKADINITNRATGWTPCHCAAFQGHGKVVLYLMDHNPDLTLKDKAGRTSANFGSALDTVWPFFAAAGCQRTGKDDLIKMDIVKKVVTDPASDDAKDKITSSLPSRVVKPHFSRPGSSYVLQKQPLPSVKPSKAATAALMFGDVLSEES